MERPFAWIAVVAATIAALSVLLPWHTVEVKNPLVVAGSGNGSHLLTHKGVAPMPMNGYGSCEGLMKAPAWCGDNTGRYSGRPW